MIGPMLVVSGLMELDVFGLVEVIEPRESTKLDQCGSEMSGSNHHYNPYVVDFHYKGHIH